MSVCYPPPQGLGIISALSIAALCGVSGDACMHARRAPHMSFPLREIHDHLCRSAYTPWVNLSTDRKDGQRHLKISRLPPSTRADQVFCGEDACAHQPLCPSLQDLYLPVDASASSSGHFLFFSLLSLSPQQVQRPSDIRLHVRVCTPVFVSLPQIHLALSFLSFPRICPAMRDVCPSLQAAREGRGRLHMSQAL